MIDAGSRSCSGVVSLRPFGDLVPAAGLRDLHLSLDLFQDRANLFFGKRFDYFTRNSQLLETLSQLDRINDDASTARNTGGRSRPASRAVYFCQSAANWL